jgi:hypothetical protein
LGLAGGVNLYGFANGDPVNFGDPFGTCKVDVRYKNLGPGYYHAYILTTAPDNTRTEFRGGPSKGGPSSGASSSGTGGATGQASGSNSNSANSSSPGSGKGGGPDNTGPFGSVQGTTEPYNKDAVDWQDGSPPSSRVVDNDESCDSYNKSFGSTLDLITSKNVPYNPFTTNSNATVRTILERAGIKGVKPIVWAPGWSTRLF